MKSDKEPGYSRLAAFVYLFVAKSKKVSAGFGLFILSYVFLRHLCLRYCGSWCDYVCGLQSLVYLILVSVWAMNAWVDSFGVELTQYEGSRTKCLVQFLWVLFLITIEFVVFYVVIVRYFYLPLEKRGQFGDSFGALNSIMSTGALVGLWITIWIQHKQLVDDVKSREVQSEILRKQHWPVVIPTSLTGDVRIVGINNAGEVMVCYKFGFESRNMSSELLLHVLNTASIRYALTESNYSIRSKANVMPYLESKCGLMTNTRWMESFETQDAVRLMSSDRILTHVTYFQTAQGGYYATTCRHIISIDNDDVSLGVVGKLSRVLASIHKTTNNTVARALFEEGLKADGVSRDSSIKLRFETMPAEFKTEELTKEEYVDAVKDATPHCYR